MRLQAVLAVRLCLVWLLNRLLTGVFAPAFRRLALTFECLCFYGML